MAGSFWSADKSSLTASTPLVTSGAESAPATAQPHRRVASYNLPDFAGRDAPSHRLRRLVSGTLVGGRNGRRCESTLLLGIGRTRSHPLPDVKEGPFLRRVLDPLWQKSPRPMGKLITLPDLRTLCVLCGEKILARTHQRNPITDHRRLTNDRRSSDHHHRPPACAPSSCYRAYS